jgi:molybdopterin synthase catalytic subunit
VARRFDLRDIVDSFKRDPSYPMMGMIATHLGVVRGNSRTGKGSVEAVEVQYDHGVIANILNDIKSMTGIYKVFIDVNEGLLEQGEEIMVIAVGGDVREHVFAALESAVNRIKLEAVRKQEIFGEGR